MVEHNQHNKQGLPAADTGNASNPSPDSGDAAPAGHQLLDERAEKYLREVSSPEDYADPQDSNEMDEQLKKERSS